ncbi:MAG: tRNA (adenosine(37)-N6)-threonylcarbamoyltransferase complex transferase subunit TsaD [Ureaplasma sp.]|nr:tRNA (adenosine(37)-N6)-threonylcarbamoyltransferase complex transferase subunit TsaD [Ureaplasma sp.]
MKKNIIIGIETSCDETSIAIYENDKFVDEITTSSMQIQSNFGGVVPEIATRYHQNNIHKIFKKILEKNNTKINEITHVVYTAYPGLPGCLHVGACFALTLSELTNSKLVPINHLYGHIFSGFIDKNIEIEFPMIGVVVSGGHTTIYYVKSIDEIEILNETQDDAVGEVLDKVGRSLDWKYPAGPLIDKLFDPNKAVIKLVKNNFSPQSPFSFSGIKTAALNYVNNHKQKNEPLDEIELTSSVQKLVIDDVVNKVKYWLKEKQCDKVCLGGGVSANKYLRNELSKIQLKQLILPNLKYTGDQATMIAYYGMLLINFKNL